MAATIVVDVVSAESSVYSGQAHFVALPGQEGELGILPGHVPLLTRIARVQAKLSALSAELQFIKK